MEADSARAKEARVRIAYVSQFCDILLPPKQNSIGGCTYGLARAVAGESDVTAFGVEFPGIQAGGELRGGVRFRFFAPSRIDTGLRRFHSRIYRGLSRFTNGGLENPLFTEKAKRETRRILFVGAVSPQKGVHVLLKAFRTVREEFPDATLDIIGPQGTYPLSEVFSLADPDEVAAVRDMYSGDYAQKMKESVPGELKSGVLFRGKIPRKDLLEHYYSADVFAFPSLWDEGFGLPPVEAMAAGLPIVATRSGAVPESVLDGETGLLIEKNDPRALAKSLCALLSRPKLRVKMGMAGRKRVLDLFTWDHTGRKASELYRKLISSPG